MLASARSFGGSRPPRDARVAGLHAQAFGDPRTHGQAYNLVQDETPTLRELLEWMAARVGATPTLVRVTTEQVAAAGLVMREVSPFTQRWMSFMDGAKAKAALARLSWTCSAAASCSGESAAFVLAHSRSGQYFQPTPLWQAVDRVVSVFLAHPPEDRPAGYERRAREVELARRVLRDG